jgi:hypothetical protein
MEHHLTGPFWGNVVIIGIAGSITLGCVLATLRMLIRPQENDPQHPKYLILDQSPRDRG